MMTPEQYLIIGLAALFIYAVVRPIVKHRTKDIGDNYDSRLMALHPLVTPWTIGKKSMAYRNEIAEFCRWEGMEVWVEENETVYILGRSLKNDDWVEKITE